MARNISRTSKERELNTREETEYVFEEPNTTDSVIGKQTINSPITPGHIPKGINAATVVAVEIIIGNAISPIPFLAASTLFKPSSSIKRYTFSTTTIPLSTNIPSPIINPKRIIVFMV